MKFRLLVILFFATIFLTLSSNSNTDFRVANILGVINEPSDVYAVDLDEDTDNDILAASSDENIIFWFKNIDGTGYFTDPIIISDEVNGASSVFACDLDRDGDNDVISASSNDSKIAWYRNLNNSDEFSEQIVITTNATAAKCVYACDLDGDYDLDIISGSYYGYEVAWYENLDGLGTFSEQKCIQNSSSWVTSVYAIDIDCDHDNDVLAASHIDNKIVWFENENGLGDFSEQKIITEEAYGATCVYAGYIDDDNYVDVLSASFYDNKIAWYRSLDGTGFFSEQIVISEEADMASSVCAFDLDNDNDLDIISSSSNDNKIAWYENEDGNGDFSDEIIISNIAVGAINAFAADLNGDELLDILSASSVDGLIAWYPNNSFVSNIDQEQNLKIKKELSIYPNPFCLNHFSRMNTTISFSTEKQGDFTIDIYNLKGQLINSMTKNFSAKGNHQLQWEGKDFTGDQVSSGIYLFTLSQNNDIIAHNKCLVVK